MIKAPGVDYFDAFQTAHDAAEMWRAGIRASLGVGDDVTLAECRLLIEGLRAPSPSPSPRARLLAQHIGAKLSHGHVISVLPAEAILPWVQAVGQAHRGDPRRFPGSGGYPPAWAAEDTAFEIAVARAADALAVAISSGDPALLDGVEALIAAIPLRRV